MALGLQRGHHSVNVVALNLDHAVFHRSTRSTSGPELLGASPFTTVTALPPRPLVSRDTRTQPSPWTSGF